MIRHVYYLAGIVVRADLARDLDDGAYISEHPEHGEIVFRARTELFQHPPTRKLSALSGH